MARIQKIHDYECYHFTERESKNPPAWFDTKEYWKRFLEESLLPELDIGDKSLECFKALLEFCRKHDRGPTGVELGWMVFNKDRFHRLTEPSAFVHGSSLHSSLSRLVGTYKIAHRGVAEVECPVSKEWAYQWFPGTVPLQVKTERVYAKYSKKELTAEVIRSHAIARQIQEKMTMWLSGSETDRGFVNFVNGAVNRIVIDTLTPGIRGDATSEATGSKEEDPEEGQDQCPGTSDA